MYIVYNSLGQDKKKDWCLCLERELTFNLQHVTT